MTARSFCATLATIGLLIAAAGQLFSGGSAMARGTVVESVTLQLKWTHQFQFAGYYAAVEKGYYRDAGLDVRLIPAQPGDHPMDKVVEGEAEFGVGTTDLLMLRHAGDQVVVLATIFQHSPLALMTRKTDGVLSIQEAARGLLMIEPHSAELFAYFTSEGVDHSQLPIIDHSFDVASLLRDDVDAMSVYSTDEPYLMTKEGVPYLLFRPVHGGIDFYGDNLFTTKEQLERHPERVRAFVDASAKGWAFAMANPEEVVDLILRKYETSKTREHLLFEAEEMQRLVLSDIVKIGYMNPARWRRIADDYASVGMLPPNLDLDGFLYDDYIAVDRGRLYTKLSIVAGIAVMAMLAALCFLRLYMVLRAEVAVRRRTEAELAKRKQELEDLNHQKDRLFSILGHDLRGPFGVVRGYGELLRRNADNIEPGRISEFATAIEDLTSTAIDILDNILKWARLESGSSEPVFEAFPVRDVLATSETFYAPIAGEKDIALEFDCAPDLIVQADRMMLDTVVRNLVANAIKFTTRGGSVRVAAEADGEMIRLVVSDTGVGMTTEDLAVLREANRARSRTGTAGETGSGLGLHLARRFVAALEGTIEVSSTEAVGTTIQISLSRGVAETAAA